jgi:F0F1-type ATP synthase epsilon subunit
MNNPFKCKLVSMGKLLYDGPLWQLSAKNESGVFSIRTGHCDMLAKLATGIIELAISPDERRRHSISSGLLSMRKNFCLIICEIKDSES